MTAVAFRSYRWMFWTLALIGFSADQATKYGLFHWLYSDTPRYVSPKGEAICDTPYVVFEGVFNLCARYTDKPWIGEGVLQTLRTVSGPNMPHVNHGALFGIGGDTDFGNH